MEALPISFNHVCDSLYFKEINALIHELIRQLPKVRHQIFEMKQQGIRATEIANELTIKAKTVWSQLNKAGKFLEEEFKRKGM